MTLLMPRPRRPGDNAHNNRPQPPTGRVCTGEHIPPAWRGIGQRSGHPAGRRPVKGTVYGRSVRKRALRRMGLTVLALTLAVSGLVVVVFTALLRILVL
jgi:hypothetical protein